MHPYEELFNQYEPMAARVRMLRSIVQNDVKIPAEQREAWKAEANEVSLDLIQLVRKTFGALEEIKL
jgi:hypothetical protein